MARDSVAGSAIFGSFDGLTSVLGLVVALLGAPLHVMLAGSLGLAVSSAVGMGAGEYLGDSGRSLRRAGVMAAATVVGTVLPVAPFLLLGRRSALEVAAVLVVGFGLVVGEVRSRTSSRRRAYAETFAVLALAAAAAVVASILTGSV